MKGRKNLSDCRVERASDGRLLVDGKKWGPHKLFRANSQNLLEELTWCVESETCTLNNTSVLALAGRSKEVALYCIKNDFATSQADLLQSIAGNDRLDVFEELSEYRWDLREAIAAACDHDCVWLLAKFEHDANFPHVFWTSISDSPACLCWALKRRVPCTLDSPGSFYNKTRMLRRIWLEQEGSTGFERERMYGILYNVARMLNISHAFPSESAPKTDWDKWCDHF